MLVGWGNEQVKESRRERIPLKLAQMMENNSLDAEDFRVKGKDQENSIPIPSGEGGLVRAELQETEDTCLRASSTTV